MSPAREPLPAGDGVEAFALDWITRCRPVCILPVSLSSDHGESFLQFHADGLVSLAEISAAVHADGPDPSAWIRAAVSGVFDSILYAESCLLERSRFRLDAGSVWYRPDEALPHPGGRAPDPNSPILTYVPLEGYRSETGLAQLVLDLYRAPASVPAARSAADADPGERIPDPLLAAALQGEDALWEYLGSAGISPGVGSDDAGPEPLDADPDPTHSKRSRRCRGTSLPGVAALLLIPFLLAAVPMAVRFGPPCLQNLLPGRTERRMLAALSLILMVAADSVLLFSRRSPMRLPARDPLRPGVSRIGSWLAWISGFRRDVRGSGLAGVLARVLDRGARPGSPTEPVSGSDGYERLGFLSEGEPGTPGETQGIRAYVLTAEFLVGRDPDMADLAVPDESVGRVHARITRREGSFFLTDLGSVNGTRLDGRRLDRHVAVPMPDRCRIGFANREFYFTAD